MALLAELVQDGDEEKNVEGDDKEDHGEDDDKEDHVEDDDTKVLNWTFMDIDDFSLTFLSPFSHLPLTSPSPSPHSPSPSSLKPVKVSPHPPEVGRSLLRMRAGPWT